LLRGRDTLAPDRQPEDFVAREALAAAPRSDRGRRGCLIPLLFEIVADFHSAVFRRSFAYRIGVHATGRSILIELEPGGANGVIALRRRRSAGLG
jgi:hypothetical protein